jgi:hypothetical protein
VELVDKAVAELQPVRVDRVADLPYRVVAFAVSFEDLNAFKL